MKKLEATDKTKGKWSCKLVRNNFSNQLCGEYLHYVIQDCDIETISSFNKKLKHETTG